MMYFLGYFKTTAKLVLSTWFVAITWEDILPMLVELPESLKLVAGAITLGLGVASSFYFFKEKKAASAKMMSEVEEAEAIKLEKAVEFLKDMNFISDSPTKTELLTALEEYKTFIKHI